ncbi:Putative lysophospholipase [Musa troglodytarum]|uniref:Lysophospholipase n=1 Tax=Musa troglodytarum TaxID=320322 RepID=A0A9E7H7U2_9LILI|nr:Putative lysophospholipase [Musa troglodytarum]
MRWEGVDKNVAKMVSETKLDQARERRKVREAFKDVQLRIDHCLFKGNHTGLRTKESYEVNSRGLEIFSKSWLPENSSIQALVCFCHGYGDTCTFFFEGVAMRLASSGYGVFAMDLPGFGLSEGLHGYIPNFDYLVDDVIEHFSKIKENPEYNGLPSFMFGGSMGAAIALKVHFKQPDSWDGAILVAPMCKISDEIMPPWPVKQFLVAMAKLLPEKKIVPLKDLGELAFRDRTKLEQASYNVLRYRGKARLRTALEIIRTTREIEQRLEEGEFDSVTDPSGSKALHEKASCTDKKLCLYEDSYHALLEGEPDEMIIQILNDIFSWLDDHVKRLRR